MQQFIKNNLKNCIVVLVFVLYSVIVGLILQPVYDANICIQTTESTDEGEVLQLFYDIGNGYNAEDHLDASMQEGAYRLTLDKELFTKISAYRIDPVHYNKNLTVTQITINDREVPLQQFVEMIASWDQLQIGYTDIDKEAGILLEAMGDDPQIYMTPEFGVYVQDACRLPLEKKCMLWGIGAVLALLGIFYRSIGKAIYVAVSFFEDRLKKLLEGENKRKAVLAVALFVVLTGIIMWQYFIGQKMFIFIDASDSYVQTYPNLLSIARKIATGHVTGNYNFAQGLGAPEGATSLTLANWVCWFGEAHVAYLMGLSQILKMILACGLFYAFLRVKGTASWLSAVLALGYGYCGHMTVRASWENYPNEIVLVALWLLCFELWFARRDYRWLPICTVVFFYNFNGGYYLMFYMAFFIGYAIFRYLTERKIKGKFLLIGVVLTAVAGAVILTRPYVVLQLQYALSSERAQQTIGSIDWSLKGFTPSWAMLPYLFARAMNPGTLGIVGQNYTGLIGFLEDSALYCGIIVLLLIPVAFYSMNLQKRIGYGLVYLVAAVYCLVEPVRIMANGFSGNTFKLSSFWISIFLIFTIAQIDPEKIRQKEHRWVPAVLIIGAALALLCALVYLPDSIEVDREQINLCMFFLIAESILLLLVLYVSTWKYVVKTVLILLVVAETVAFSYPLFNNRETADATVYMDGTEEAIEYLKEQDGNTFYRMDKQYVTVHMCDSLAQDYYGTAMYAGGTGFSNEVIRFMRDLVLPGRVNGDNRAFYGTTAHNEISTLLGIKYAITKEDSFANYGYEKTAELDSVSIYENTKAAQMGFVYQYAIERSEFEKLTSKQRQMVLLEACLVEDGSSLLPLLPEERIEEIKQQEELFNQYEIEYQSAENYSFVFEPTTEEEVLVVQMSFDKAGKGYLCYSTVDEKSGRMILTEEIESTGQMYEIAADGVNRIWVDSPNWAELLSLRIAKIPKIEYYALYERNTQNIRENAVSITSYRDNYMEAEVNAKTDGMLYLPIVNAGWYVSVDGTWQDSLMTINDAFIGVPIGAGEHSLIIKYPDGEFWYCYKRDIARFAIAIGIVIVGTILMRRKKKEVRA